MCRWLNGTAALMHCVRGLMWKVQLFLLTSCFGIWWVSEPVCVLWNFLLLVCSWLAPYGSPKQIQSKFHHVPVVDVEAWCGYCCIAQMVFIPLHSMGSNCNRNTIDSYPLQRRHSVLLWDLKITRLNVQCVACVSVDLVVSKSQKKHKTPLAVRW